jgi:hypothetical protein
MSLWSTSAKHRFIPAPVTGHSLIANVDLSLQEKIMKEGMISPKLRNFPLGLIQLWGLGHLKHFCLL